MAHHATAADWCRLLSDWSGRQWRRGRRFRRFRRRCSRDLFLCLRCVFGAAFFAVAVLLVLLLLLLSLYIILLILLLLVVPVRLSQVAQRCKKALEVLCQLFLWSRGEYQTMLDHGQQQGRHSHLRPYH